MQLNFGTKETATDPANPTPAQQLAAAEFNQVVSAINNLYPVAETHSTTLSFAKNTYMSSAYVQTGALTYTLAASGNMDGATKMLAVTSDGVSAIAFPAAFKVYGLNTDGTNAGILPVGTYSIWMVYLGGRVEVSIPGGVYAGTGGGTTDPGGGTTDPGEPNTLGGTELRYSFSTASGYTEAGGKATELIDKAGGDNNATQPTTNYQAYTDIANKQISFTGTQYYSIPPVTISTLGFTVFAVVDRGASADHAVLGSLDGKLSIRMRWIDVYFGAGAGTGAAAGIASKGTGTEAEFRGRHVWCFRFNGSTLDVFRDAGGTVFASAAASMGTVGSGVTNKFELLGANGSTFTNKLTGNIGELEIVTRAATNEEVTTRMAEIKAEFGL